MFFLPILGERPSRRVNHQPAHHWGCLLSIKVGVQQGAHIPGTLSHPSRPWLRARNCWSRKHPDASMFPAIIPVIWNSNNDGFFETTICHTGYTGYTHGQVLLHYDDGVEKIWSEFSHGWCWLIKWWNLQETNRRTLALGNQEWKYDLFPWLVAFLTVNVSATWLPTQLLIHRTETKIFIAVISISPHKLH